MTIKNSNDAFGDRMKDLERIETGRKFIPGLPVYARIDGRGFSKFTKGMNRPFDQSMTDTMIATTKVLVDKTHATIGYVQSDEISLVWIPTANNGMWFDHKITKMTSVLAGLASSAFVVSMIDNFINWIELSAKMPHFDARVIAMPNETEAANMLLWRNLDATKNAVSMAAGHYYSHKQLQGKNASEKQEMLFEKGINFNDYPSAFKRGTWVRRSTITKTLTPEELAIIPERHRPLPGEQVTRTVITAFDIAPLNKIANRPDVLFHGAVPITNP